MSMLLTRAMCAVMSNPVIMLLAEDEPSGGGGWEVNNVLNNVRELLITVGQGLMMIIGVVMIIVGIFKIASGLMSHGKQQVNWVINILLILVGALFCAGSVFFTMFTNNDGNNSVGGMIADELNNLGQGDDTGTPTVNGGEAT